MPSLPDVRSGWHPPTAQPNPQAPLPGLARSARHVLLRTACEIGHPFGCSLACPRSPQQKDPSDEPGEISAVNQTDERTADPTTAFDQLEVRDVPSATLALDFDTQASPTAVRYTKAKLTTYTPTNHFGWQSKTGMNAINRSVGNALNRDLHTGRDGRFSDVPKWDYDLVIGLGDASYAGPMWLWAEGTLLASKSRPGKPVHPGAARVTVTDSQLNLHLADAGGDRVFRGHLPDISTATDPNAQTFGARQLPSVASASGLRRGGARRRFPGGQHRLHHRNPLLQRFLNSGTHTGSLWTVDGTAGNRHVPMRPAAAGRKSISPHRCPSRPTRPSSRRTLPPRGLRLRRNYFAVSGMSNGKLTVRQRGRRRRHVCVWWRFPDADVSERQLLGDVVFASETVPPTVESVSPADQATDVPTSTTVQVTFKKQWIRRRFQQARSYSNFRRRDRFGNSCTRHASQLSLHRQLLTGIPLTP